MPRISVFAGRCIILLFMLGCFVSCGFASTTPYKLLMFWCFTSDNLQLSYLELGLEIGEDDTIFMAVTTEFDLHGTQQFLKFWIDCIPMSPNNQFTNATISVMGTYLEIDGARERSSAYNKSISIKPEAIVGIKRIEYSLNFTNEIQGVQRQVYPEESPENCGVYGHLTLENTIYGVIGQMDNKRYLRLSLHASAASAYTWHLYPVIIIPQKADWIRTKINNEDMIETFPNQRMTTIPVTPLGQSDAQIYAAWEIPPPVSWQEKVTQFPYSFAWSFLVGFLAGLASKYTYDWVSTKWSERKQKKKSKRSLSATEKTLPHDLSNFLLRVIVLCVLLLFGLAPFSIQFQPASP